MPKEPLWRVPKLWPGEECFILGGGPSLGQIDIERLRGRRVIAVNQAFKLAPWIDVLFFGDCRWLSQYGQTLIDFAGLRVTTCEKHHGVKGVLAVRRKNGPFGISRDPSVLLWNLSSGACAVGLAAHFGVKRIVLLGFDMRKIDDKAHWHEDYVKMRGSKVKEPYNRFMRPFPQIAKDLARRGVECVNASPGSALTEFPIVEQEEVLCSPSPVS